MKVHHHCQQCHGLTISLIDAQVMLAEMERLAEATASCFDALSANAQASALELGSALGGVKRKLELIVALGVEPEGKANWRTTNKLAAAIHKSQ